MVVRWQCMVHMSNPSMWAEDTKADGLLWDQQNSGVYNIFYVVRPCLKKIKDSKSFWKPSHGFTQSSAS